VVEALAGRYPLSRRGSKEQTGANRPKLMSTTSKMKEGRIDPCPGVKASPVTP